MTGRSEDVPDPERRRAANAALTSSIEEVCRRYAPSGARVEDRWEVRGAAGAVMLRVFLAGPMQGSWIDTATGERGDALDLVARLSGRDGALAEAERFLARQAAKAERQAEDAGGGQMALFGALPEDPKRKRPAQRSGKGRKGGASRRAAAQPETPAAGTTPRPGGEPSGAGEAAGRMQPSPDVPRPAPEDRTAEPGPGESGPPATGPDGVAFTADDRQRLRRMAEDAAWIRSRLTPRSPDAGAHERAEARRDERDRRWRLRMARACKAAGSLALLFAVWNLPVAVDDRYALIGLADLLAAYGAELTGDARILPGGDGG